MFTLQASVLELASRQMSAENSGSVPWLSTVGTEDSAAGRIASGRVQSPSAVARLRSR